MKKIFFSIYIIIILFLLCGCWDYTPLENNNTVTGIGIDEGINSTETILVSFSGPAQTQGNSSQNSGSEVNALQSLYYYVGAEGKSIMDAYINAQNKTQNILSINNLRTIIISRKVAEKSIDNYLDPLLRNAQVNPNTLIVVSESTAKELLQFRSKCIDRIPIYLTKLISSSNFRAPSLNYSLKELNYAFNSENYTFAVPYIVLNMQEGKIRYSQIGIFRKTKMAAVLSEDESFAYLLLRGVLRRGFLSEEGSSYLLYPRKRTVKASMENMQTTFNLYFKLSCDIIEKTSEMNQPDYKKQYADKISSLLKKNISELIKKI
jgi:spore germination protein KC